MADTDFVAGRNMLSFPWIIFRKCAETSNDKKYLSRRNYNLWWGNNISRKGELKPLHYYVRRVQKKGMIIAEEKHKYTKNSSTDDFTCSNSNTSLTQKKRFQRRDSWQGNSDEGRDHRACTYIRHWIVDHSMWDKVTRCRTDRTSDRTSVRSIDRCWSSEFQVSKTTLRKSIVRKAIIGQ